MGWRREDHILKKIPLFRIPVFPCSRNRGKETLPYLPGGRVEPGGGRH